MNQSGMMAVNGADLYYEARGEGHPLVLVHAAIADSRMWDDQMDAFSARYTVVRFDMRGYGRSTLPHEPAATYEDIYGLLRALEMAKAHLIGVSMGGGMVIDFTLAHPDMATALIPVGPGLGGFEVWPNAEEMAIFEEATAAMKAGDFDRATDLNLHAWVDGPGRSPDQVDPGLRARAREMMAPTIAHAAEQNAIGSIELDPPAATRLGEIHAPTLVIVGDQDCSDIHAGVDAIAAGVPGARKVVIQGAAHVPNMERPAEFNRVVLDFLAGL